MTFLGRTFIFTTKHRTLSYWSSKLYCSVATLSSFGDESTKDFGKIDGDNERHVSNVDLGVQNTIRQSVAHGQKRLKFIDDISKGPGLKDFVTNSSAQAVTCESVPYVRNTSINGLNRRVYFEVYGCQMNVNDTEIVWSILKDVGYLKTECIQEADVILIVTCAIREGAELKVWNKLKHFKSLKKTREKQNLKPQLKIGILGCMAERLKHQLLEKEQAVDIVAGPDSYKDLPRLLTLTDNNQTAVNVLLSLDETYADIVPVRLNQDSVTSFVSVQLIRRS